MSWISDFKNRRDVLITAINGSNRAIQALEDQISGHRSAIDGYEFELAALDRALNANVPQAPAAPADPVSIAAPITPPGNPPSGAPAWGSKSLLRPATEAPTDKPTPAPGTRYKPDGFA